MSTNNQKVYIM